MLSAYLLSTDAREELDFGGGGESSGSSRDKNEDEQSPQAEVLPVMLLWGAKPLAEALMDNVQRCFDCVVAKVNFTKEDLQWASAMWCSLCDKEESEEFSVKLTYVIPRGTVDVELKQSQLAQLWHSCHDKRETVATVHEVECFHAALSAHLDKAMGLRTSGFGIKRITLPAVTMDARGTVSVAVSAHAKTVLRFLTGVCQLKLESFTPRIGITSGETLLY